MLAERQGRYADALEHAEQALRLYQAIGDKASEADALNNVGWYHGLLGDYQQARAFCRQALTLSAEAGHHWLEGYVWDSLGYAEHHLGNLAEAAACYQRALSLHREAGDRFDEADTLTHLGDTRHAAGEAGAGPGGLAAGARHPRGPAAPRRRPGPRQARQHKRPRLSEPIRVTTRRSPPASIAAGRATGFAANQRKAPTGRVMLTACQQRLIWAVP